MRREEKGTWAETTRRQWRRGDRQAEVQGGVLGVGVGQYISVPLISIAKHESLYSPLPYIPHRTPSPPLCTPHLLSLPWGRWRCESAERGVVVEARDNKTHLSASSPLEQRLGSCQVNKQGDLKKPKQERGSILKGQQSAILMISLLVLVLCARLIWHAMGAPHNIIRSA